ncbi:amidohydrolase [Rhizobium sp. Leaf384]|uniref:amidohydrolase family protein n=1 Tax=unclassified Rhizobium TaxID=2613769 RepID=UPI0007135963|nr:MULTISPECIES: amidohydrolase family protein [unclassified Rhizobium]KQS75303.1 amidohydrolase [Rhizobium sp. Leaf383]KQS78780.1 amidohydrolase [Rhizobium sp. Leaf384]
MLVRPLSGPAPKTVFPSGAVDSQMHMYLPGYPAQPGGPDLPAGSLPDADQYRAFMAWLGIDRVIITQGNAHQRDNENLIACLAEMGNVARGVAVIDATTSERELDRLSAAGVVGVRIMDLPGGAVGLDALETVDAMAASRGWMLAVQFDGNRILDHAPRLKALKARWVFDHHGKFFAGATPDGPEITALRQLMDGGRCWFKFAGAYESSRTGGPDYADVAAFSKVLAAHAPERIVWGSNWPHNLAKTQDAYPDDVALTDTVLGWIGDEAAVRQALVDNPEELFGLPAWQDSRS